MKKLGGLLGIFYIVTFISYIVNLVQLFNCDFASPWKDEIIHAVGVVIPFASIVTVWF